MNLQLFQKILSTSPQKPNENVQNSCEPKNLTLVSIVHGIVLPIPSIAILMEMLVQNKIAILKMNVHKKCC
jgi:hypothetical protein